MTLTIAVFNRNKLHQVPPILQDYAVQLQNLNNSPEVRENYAQKFEVMKEYCDYVLDIHRQIKRETPRKRR